MAATAGPDKVIQLLTDDYSVESVIALTAARPRDQRRVDCPATGRIPNRIIEQWQAAQDQQAPA